jgi:DNA-binding response OmpR family regulator
MARLNYETADTLIYDPVASHRNATRSALYTLGFRNIETAPTLDAFNEIIWKSSPDLALCEAQGADAQLCEMIQNLRQGHSGHTNPFLVIMVTAWEKNHALVSRVLNSGADDLLLRPFSVNLLRTRIDTHVERRKHFVITHDYVGPDRRSDPNRASTVAPFLPPNSLKMKAKDGLSMQETQARLSRELRIAKDTLNAEKLRRDAYQICILWRLLQEPDDPGNAMHLAKLAAMTQSVAKRCRMTEFEAAQEWCDSVQAAVEGLHFGVDRNASMHLLGHAALSLNHLLQPDVSKADHLRNIEQTVEMIRARAVGRSTADDPLLKATPA